VRRDGAERSQPYPYSIRGFADSSLDVEYVQCHGKCHHDEERVGCHLDCSDIVSPETFLKIYEVTAPDFEPSAIANKQRLRWLRSWLASILGAATHYRLPPEIYSDIAARTFEHHIERSLTVWYADERRAEMRRKVSRVAMSKKIYARTVDFEGVQYISRLTNTAAGGLDVMVFDPISRTPADRLYVASDHLGIRQLLFANSLFDYAIKQEPDVWWQTVSLDCLGGFIRAQGDGLKLRKIAGESIQLPKVAWGLPQPSYKPIRLEKTCSAEPTFRMSVLPCNDSQTTAYSLCWNQSILLLHAHTVGEELEFYQSLRTMDESALWFYMPLHAGEVLTEIWKCDGCLGSAIALLLVTSRGRSSFLGVQPQRGWSRSKWTLLDLPSKTPSRIYMMTATFGVPLLGFESPRPDRQNRTPMVEWPTSPYPKCRRHENFAWSRANLMDVVEIIPCRHRRQGMKITSGLLLRYDGGHQACVGQVRLDQLEIPLGVDYALKLWLGFSLTHDGPCVSNIKLSREIPTLPVCENWFQVDWCNDLEWWYSDRQCQLSQQGRMSPATIA
ncbi:hypothetical protein CSHISOI_01677, partial [Colletotrichum shisoi]